MPGFSAGELLLSQTHTLTHPRHTVTGRYIRAHTHKHTHRDTLDTSGVSHVPDCVCIINSMLMRFRAALWRVKGRFCCVGYLLCWNVTHWCCGWKEQKLSCHALLQRPENHKFLSVVISSCLHACTAALNFSRVYPTEVAVRAPISRSARSNFTAVTDLACDASLCQGERRTHHFLLCDTCEKLWKIPRGDVNR